MAIVTNNAGKGLFGTTKDVGNSTRELKRANVWLNVGYQVEVDAVDEKGEPNGTVQRFVSLPMGIALDTMEPLNIKGQSTSEYNMLQQARNELLEQIMAGAKELAPGESRIVNLSVEIRHVQADYVPADPKSNPFALKLEL